MPRFYRTFAGPAVIGVSVWCAAGTVAVLSSSGDGGRVVALAPWWVMIAAAAVAALVPAWRTRPSTALPALFSTLPWWPVPLPAVALVWAGALAWVPIGAALMAALGSAPLTLLARTLGANEASRATRLAGIASLIVAALAAWSADPRVPGGDEPHYLVITQSLLKDGDLRIENNHAARDYASYFGGTINPDFLARGRDDVIYSIHAPGVSAIVLPAFALFGFRGAQATVIVLFAIAGALMWRAAWRLTSDPSAAWFGWAAVVGSTTMAVLSFMIFPETPGVCAVAAGVWLLVAHRTATARALVAVSAALAVLPWLHTRFSVLAGTIGIGILLHLLTDRSQASPSRWRRAMVFLVVPAASAVAWLSMFYVLYGTVDPRVPYGPNPELRPWIWGAVTGLFIDQQFGLMTYAPILCVAFLGPALAARGPERNLVLLSIGIVLVYAMAVASYWMWWAGVPALPARFLTAALPLLVIPMALAWSRSTAGGRALLLGLLVVALGVTLMVLGVDRAAMAWNDRRSGAAPWLEWLNPVVNLPRAWPSFFWNGEGAFLRHAGVFVVILTVTGLAIRQAVRRFTGHPDAQRLHLAVWMLVGFMVMAQAGWTVTASAPLNPARSQLEVHGLAASGRSLWLIGSGVSRWNAGSRPLRITRSQTTPADVPSPVVVQLVNVPAGLYTLEITAGRIPTGLTLRIGRSAPVQRFAIPGSQVQSFPLELPAGAAVLTLEADNAGLGRQVQAVLIPASPARATKAFARQFVRYATAGAYFVDGNVFPEGSGFWVRGGSSTEVVLSHGAGSANRAASLAIRNGAAANTVTIESGAWQEVLTLSGGETRVVALPQADALGAWPLKITSASGFRPSDTAGEDRRFLGVWVEMTF